MDDPSVRTIICPVRASGDIDATRRVQETLSSRGRNAADLDTMFKKVHCTPIDTLTDSQPLKLIQDHRSITLIHVSLPEIIAGGKRTHRL
jgi:hypothetical protein